eukprot:GHVL01025729.1.p1 GENE.GHVL01025729.1~~GHVL01025729.1.p1  ORF type:complete len:185 (+),score=59.46 GHVL01025729.1:55-555(+)
MLKCKIYPSTRYFRTSSRIPETSKFEKKFKKNENLKKNEDFEKKENFKNLEKCFNNYKDVVKEIDYAAPEKGWPPKDRIDIVTNMGKNKLNIFVNNFREQNGANRWTGLCITDSINHPSMFLSKEEFESVLHIQKDIQNDIIEFQKMLLTSKKDKKKKVEPVKKKK